MVQLTPGKQVSVRGGGPFIRPQRLDGLGVQQHLTLFIALFPTNTGGYTCRCCRTSPQGVELSLVLGGGVQALMADL